MIFVIGLLLYMIGGTLRLAVEWGNTMTWGWRDLFSTIPILVGMLMMLVSVAWMILGWFYMLLSWLWMVML